jgi:hypothetical protein
MVGNPLIDQPLGYLIGLRLGVIARDLVKSGQSDLFGRAGSESLGDGVVRRIGFGGRMLSFDYFLLIFSQYEDGSAVDRIFEITPT